MFTPMTPQQLIKMMKLIADHNLTVEQAQAWIESGLIRDFFSATPRSIDRKAFQAFLRGESAPKDGLWIDLDPSLDFEALKRQFEGKNEEGWVDPEFTHKHLSAQSEGSPDSYRGLTRVECHLVPIERRMTDKEVLQKVSDLELRAAGLRECFVFGMTYPHLLRQDSLIVGLGSRWDHSDGLVFVPYLDRHGGQRQLSRSWSGPRHQWYDYTRFLALSK